MMRRLMILAVIAALSGCATVNGIGQDISGGASTVEGWLS